MHASLCTRNIDVRDGVVFPPRLIEIDRRRFSIDRGAVFVRIAVIVAGEFCMNIVSGIIDGVAGTAITDFEIDDVGITSIAEMMVAGSGPKSCAHPWSQQRFAIIGD
jgi:hypothetical protein